MTDTDRDDYVWISQWAEAPSGAPYDWRGLGEVPKPRLGPDGFDPAFAPGPSAVERAFASAVVAGCGALCSFALLFIVVALADLAHAAVLGILG